MSDLHTSLVLLGFTFLFGCSTSYEVVEVSFSNDDISLSGNIYRPINTQYPVPAVIMVHGSKNHTKDHYSEYSKYFAENGITVLNYDNRGHGNSTGNLWTSTFYDMASDVVAGIEFLSDQVYVDPERIGIWADSHGGWISLIADSLSEDIDFIISKSGPAVSPLETVLFDIENNYLKEQNVPDSTAERLLGLYPMIFEYLTRNRTDSLWTIISTQLENYRGTPFFKNDFDEFYEGLLKPPAELARIDEIEIAPSGRNYDFDPVPLMKSLDTPTLIVYGTSDDLIPVDKCIQIIENIDNPDITLCVYPNADHGIRIKSGVDVLVAPRFPKSYLRSLTSFITEGSPDCENL